MPFNRDLWRSIFKSASFPKYPCPECGTGRVVLVEDSLFCKEPEYSKANAAGPDWEPNWTVQRFSARMICDERTCQEIVHVIGDMTYFWDVDEEYGPVVREVLRPRAMFPAAPIIELPKGCPDDVSQKINEAFGLFWSDYAACANRMRASVERLLDDLKVPTSGLNKKGETVTLDLNGRIQYLSKTEADHAASLDALRMIGNLGSHSAEVSHEAILDAFEIYEDCLSELVGRRSSYMKSLKAKVASTKGKY